MKKIKKIFVCVSVVSVLAVVLCLSSFAYVSSDGQSPSMAKLPMVMTKDVNNQRTALPYDRDYSSDNVLARAGNVYNSVRIISAITEYYPVASGVTQYDGALVFSMLSDDPFEFTVDFGNIGSNLRDYADFLGIDYDYDPFRVFTGINISLVVGGYTEVSADGNIPMGDYIPIAIGNDFSASVNYSVIEGDEFVSKTNSLEYDVSTVTSVYRLYTGGDGDFLNTVQGSFSYHSSVSIYSVMVCINTHHLTDYGLSYYIDDPNTTSNYTFSSFELNHYSSALASINSFSDGIDVGYDTGYSEGFNTGLDAGVDIGYEEGLDIGFEMGYTEGFDDGFSERGMFDFLMDSIKSFLDFPLFSFPGTDYTISLGHLLGTIVGAMCFVWLLKLIAGG